MASQTEPTFNYKRKADELTNAFLSASDPRQIASSGRTLKRYRSNRPPESLVHGQLSIPPLVEVIRAVVSQSQLQNAPCNSCSPLKIRHSRRLNLLSRNNSKYDCSHTASSGCHSRRHCMQCLACPRHPAHRLPLSHLSMRFIHVKTAIGGLRVRIRNVYSA